MALFQRGKKGIWWYEFEFRGRRYRESSRTTSERLAGQIERKRHREIEAANGGIKLDPVRPVLFSVAATEWLTHREPTWAPKTYIGASIDIEHLKTRLGKLLLTDIDATDISDYVTHRRTKGAADKTIRNEIGTLRGILKHHKLWAQLSEHGISLPRAREDSPGIALSLEQEEKLLKACAASRSRSLLPVVTLALSTGLRHDELRLLRWKQIDFVHEAIKVGRSKTEHGSGRAVHLNQRALTAIRDWANQFSKRKATDFVFPTERVGFSGNDEIPQVFDTDPKKPITSWKVAWASARTAASVDCRFHDLRHTACTRLLEAGTSFAVVATIMGWSAATSLRMVKVYGHIGASPQRAAMAALDNPAATQNTGDTSTATMAPGSTTVQ